MRLELGNGDVLLYEFKADLNKYLGALGPPARVRSLADLIACNEANRSREMPFFGQDLLTRAQKGTTHRQGPIGTRSRGFTGSPERKASTP